MAVSNNVLLGLIAVTLVLSSVGVAANFMPRAPTASTLEPMTRIIYVNAIEPKGSASNATEPFPTNPLPSGGGYILKPPDASGTWTVETYIWEPSVIVVYQGDNVTLQILGVNGKEHRSQIENYVGSFNVKRGQLTTLNFVADKVGTFRIVCVDHQPSMTGYLIVLPRQ